MTTNQQNAYNALGSAASELNDKEVAYLAAKSAVDQANAALVVATSGLDTAWSDFKAKTSAFTGVLLAAPSGYTPPV
jgi:hypothetical protein